MSSDAYHFAGVDVDDLNWQTRRYNRWKAYGASKTANMLYTSELARR